MIEIKSPDENDYVGTSVFLGGSLTIENDWRASFVEKLKDTNLVLMNPHRDDCKDLENDHEAFIEHVEWVNDTIQNSDIIVLYFYSKTESAISVLDMADMLRSKNVILCVDDGFWKRNLIISAAIEFNVDIINNLDDVIEKLKGIDNASD